MDWLSLKVSDFCKTGSGGTPSTNQKNLYYGGNIPWVKSGELMDDALNSTEESLTELGLKESSAKWVPSGAVLVAMYGATVGRTAYLSIDATTNQAICHIIPDSKIADGKFIWYLIRSRFNELLTKRAGGAQPNINQQIIKNTILHLPPPSEQKRIVEILDQADALRKKRAEADKIAERIIPALFYKMFGNPIELINNEKSVSLEDFNIELQNGFACGQKNIKGGIPHLRMNNIDDLGYLNLDLVRTVPTEFKKQRYVLSNGDLLFMATNSVEKIGKTCVFYIKSNSTYLYSNHLTRIRIKDDLISPEYLSAFLHILWTKRFYPAISKRWVNQATVSNTALKNLKVFVPDETKRLIFDKTYKELILVREQRNYAKGKIDNLFGALLYKAFSGELTAKWREAHLEELLREMEIQVRYLDGVRI